MEPDPATLLTNGPSIRGPQPSPKRATGSKANTPAAAAPAPVAGAAKTQKTQPVTPTRPANAASATKPLAGAASGGGA